MIAVDVSVVIPTHDRPETLELAVRSALAQPGVAVEVIVVDDSETGSARPAVARIGDARVRYFRHSQPSAGHPSAPRNAAWLMAAGRYVYFLDDDDLLEEGALAELVAALDVRPNVGVAVGTVRPFGDDEQIVAQSRAHFERAARRMRDMHGRTRLVAALLYSSAPLNSGACMIRRSALEAVGGYATDVPRCEGIDLYARAIRRFGFVFVDRVVSNYRISDRSLMHDPTAGQAIAESYRRIHQRYRREHGTAELLALRAVAWIATLFTLPLLA